MGQLCDRLDDAAGLCHRMPVGSGGHRAPGIVYFPRSKLPRALPHLRPACFSAARVARSGADRVAAGAQLSRYSLERDVSECDDLRSAAAGRDFRRSGSGSWPRRKFFAPVQRRAAGVDTAGVANCAVLHDRVRSGIEGGRGIAPGFSRARLHARAINGYRGGNFLLYRGNRHGLLGAALAVVCARKVFHRGGAGAGCRRSLGGECGDGRRPALADEMF